MILGIGLDLCDIGRMNGAIERQHFVDRVYTAAEAGRIRSASDVRRGEIAAGLFAAKEAVAKALGTGFSKFGTADIEITPDPDGRPLCVLHNNALAQARAMCGGSDDFRIWVSITHEKDMAAATAILEG